MVGDRALTTEKISVLIPVYRGSESFPSLLERLVKDPYENKEIITIIDEPNENSRDLVKKYSDVVRFIIHKERTGKAKALNEAIKISTGDIILFIDADTTIGNDERFLYSIAEEMKDVDVLDVKKVIKGKGLISKMVYYEYLGFNAANWLLCRLSGRTPGLNGACFVVRKEALQEVGGVPYVISEDLELALNLSMSNARFKYTEKIYVETEAPTTWKGWMKQRMRWSVGAGYWVRSNFRRLVGLLRQSPLILLSSLLLIFPSILASFGALTLNQTAIAYQYMALLLTLLHLQNSLSMIIFLPVGFASLRQIIYFGYIMIFSSFVTSTVFYLLSRKLKFKFNILEFLAYYLVYSPLWLSMVVYGLALAFFSKKPRIDWKV